MGLRGGRFKVVVGHGGTGQRGVGEGSASSPVLLVGFLGGACGEGGGLVGSVEIPERVGVFPVEVGLVDEACPFRLLPGDDHLSPTLRFDD